MVNAAWRRQCSTQSLNGTIRAPDDRLSFRTVWTSLIYSVDTWTVLEITPRCRYRWWCSTIEENNPVRKQIKNSLPLAYIFPAEAWHPTVKDEGLAWKGDLTKFD
jgi:hypothetical protein